MSRDSVNWKLYLLMNVVMPSVTELDRLDIFADDEPLPTNKKDREEDHVGDQFLESRLNLKIYRISWTQLLLGLPDGLEDPSRPAGEELELKMGTLE